MWAANSAGGVCIAGNEVGDAGAFALARALPQMAHLTTLDLGSVERGYSDSEGGASFTCIIYTARSCI